MQPVGRIQCCVATRLKLSEPTTKMPSSQTSKRVPQTLSAITPLTRELRSSLFPFLIASSISAGAYLYTRDTSYR